jgi:hypothetical protein
LDANAQFRITVWPGTPVPLPRYQRTHCSLSQARDALLFTYDRDELVEPRGETYLELYNLDLENPDEILDFANRHSVLRGEEMFQRLKAAGFFDWGLNLRRSWTGYFRKWHRPVYENAYRENLLLEEGSPIQSVETLFEFRFAAHVLRDMTSSWRLLSTRVDPKSLPWSGWATGEPGYLSARSLLAKTLPLLLRNYSPVLGLRSETNLAGEGWRKPVISAEFPESSAPLYEVCAFELLNHIAEGATYRICQNESCGRPFVRQWGRSELGQSRREGVLYCSAACARAQAQRQYRRRRQTRENRI